MNAIQSTHSSVTAQRTSSGDAAAGGRTPIPSGQEFAALMQEAVQPVQAVEDQAAPERTAVGNFLSHYPNKATPGYSQLLGLLESHPAVEAAINKVAEISGTQAPLFSSSAGDLSAAIRNLAADIDRIGESQALKNFFKEQRNLVGFGTSNWFGSHHMGNAEYAAYQTVINDLVKPVSEQSWNAQVVRYGFDPEMTWRDPASGRGIGVGTDAGKTRAEKIGYFDASGQLLKTSIVAELPVYENAERFGISLSGVDALAQKLEQKKIQIEPGEVYAGSEAGVDFTAIANGQIAGGQSAADWESSQKVQLNRQNQQAASAGMMPPATVVQAAVESIERTAAMIERYQSKMGAPANATVSSKPAAATSTPTTESQTVQAVSAKQVSATLSPALQAANMSQAVSPQLSLSNELALLDSMLAYRG